MDKEYLRKVGLSLAAAAKRGDEKAVAKWATKALIAVRVDPTDDEQPMTPVVHAVPIGPAAIGDEMYNASAGVEGSPQAEALAAGDTPYIAAGYGQSGVWLPGFTPNSARAWWAEFFASPFDMRLVDPAALPGSLVLTAEQGARAVAEGKKTNPPPPAECAGVPCPRNPNLFEGSATLEAIRGMIASGNPFYPPFAKGVTFPAG